MGFMCADSTPPYELNQRILLRPVETPKDKFQRLLQSPAATAEEWADVVNEMDIEETNQGKFLEVNFVGRTEDNSELPFTSSASVRALFTSIRNRGGIAGISFCDMEITADAWYTILEEVANDSQYTTLAVHNCILEGSDYFAADNVLVQRLQDHLIELEFIGVDFTLEDMQLLGRILKDNKVLKSLTLDASEFGDLNISPLANDLRSSSSIETLEFNYTGLSCETARTLAAAIAELPSLGKLSLEGMEEEDGLKSWMGIAGCKSIVELVLNSNMTLDREFIISVLSELPKLEKLILLDTDVDPVDMLDGLICLVTAEEEMTKRTLFVSADARILEDDGIISFMTSMNERGLVSLMHTAPAGKASGRCERIDPENEARLEQMRRELHEMNKENERLFRMVCEKESKSMLASLAIQVAAVTEEIRTAEALTQDLYARATSASLPVAEDTFEAKDARAKIFRALVQKMGLTVYTEVIGDGDCLFHSINTLTDLEGQGPLANWTRKMFVNVMHEHYSHLSIFLTEEDLGNGVAHSSDPMVNWNNYCNGMLNTKMHPGPIELQVLSQLISRRICIFDLEYGLIIEEGMQKTPDELCFGDEPAAGEPPFFLLREYNHFTPLIFQPTVSVGGAFGMVETPGTGEGCSDRIGRA